MRSCTDFPTGSGTVVSKRNTPRLGSIGVGDKIAIAGRAWQRLLQGEPLLQAQLAFASWGNLSGFQVVMEEIVTGGSGRKFFRICAVF